MRQTLLGYEVPTGEPVHVPIDHTLVAGRTRVAGKTTCLRAMVERSGLRAITFLTKPGEDVFAGARRVAPYYHATGGWQFIESVLESVMNENMKQERALLIELAQDSGGLKEVYAGVKRRLKDEKAGRGRSLLVRLKAYLELVVPQFERARFADYVEIGPGVNVIDLSDRTKFDADMQALVMRSTLDWVLAQEKGVITLIPEAWQFISRSRGSPVKAGCNALVRMGAVAENFVWFDAQDIGVLDNEIIRSVGVWILGVQQEAREVDRALAYMASGAKTPKREDVMRLGRGQFYVSANQTVRKVYVLPVWLSEADGRRIAKGQVPVASVAAPKEKPGPQGKSLTEAHRVKKAAPSAPAAKPPEPQKEPPTVSSPSADELERQNTLLERQLELRQRLASVASPPPVSGDAAPAAQPPPRREWPAGRDNEALYVAFRDRLLTEFPGLGRPVTVTPPEKLRRDFQVQEADRIVAEAKGLRPLQKRILRFVESVDANHSQKAISQRLGRATGGGAYQDLNKAVNDLRQMGFVAVDSKTGVGKALREKIAADLASYKATPQEVDATYQAVLHELATEQD